MRSSGRHRRSAGGCGGDLAGGRGCSRAGCPEPAVATLTYVYAASTAVVGPLAAYPEPHSYDLCGGHARSLTAPRGWELVRHDGELVPPPGPGDDLTALAEAVREASHPPPDYPPPDYPPPGHPAQGYPARGFPPGADRPATPPRPRGRPGYLRVVPPS